MDQDEFILDKLIVFKTIPSNTEVHFLIVILLLFIYLNLITYVNLANNLLSKQRHKTLTN